MPDANTDAATLPRVLLVDDSPWLRRSVRAALERAGLVVVGEAADGAEALTQAATHHPDLVLMDLSMPGMDGIQATQALRRQQPEIRVVLWTARDDIQLARPPRRRRRLRDVTDRRGLIRPDAWLAARAARSVSWEHTAACSPARPTAASISRRSISNNSGVANPRATVPAAGRRGRTPAGTSASTPRRSASRQIAATPPSSVRPSSPQPLVSRHGPWRRPARRAGQTSHASPQGSGPSPPASGGRRRPPS